MCKLKALATTGIAYLLSLVIVTLEQFLLRVLTRFDAHQSAEDGAQSISSPAPVQSPMEVVAKPLAPATRNRIDKKMME